VTAKLIIDLDTSGKTYAFRLLDKNGDEHLFGDGFESREEVLDHLSKERDLLIEALS